MQGANTVHIAGRAEGTSCIKLARMDKLKNWNLKYFCFKLV